MELYTMKYVLAVADCGNFSQAAQTCHVGQPALSQQIAKLERELGVPLFYRNSHGARLTEAGQIFALRTREILHKAETLESEMAAFAGIRRGSLTLGIIASLNCIDFGGLLSAFCSEYPGISVNIVQNGTHELINLLVERKIDLAFMNRPVTVLPSSLAFHKLGEDYYSLAVPADHPLAKREAVSLKELSNEPFIFHSSAQVASDLCLNACRRAGLEPNIVCRSAEPTTSLYMVQGGLGVAFLPTEEFCTHKVEGVLEIRLEEPIIKEVGIAWRRDAASPLLDAAVEFSQRWTA
ncbi:MAG: LysR family transcriptional regulator [Lachnospiraceae bacterium]|nr:LysR family transcriptional regulator [Lachnospiraceae bacterium]